MAEIISQETAVSPVNAEFIANSFAIFRAKISVFRPANALGEQPTNAANRRRRSANSLCRVPPLSPVPPLAGTEPESAPVATSIEYFGNRTCIF